MKINFKQFLTELIQSKRALDAIVSKYGKDAKIGFEIECFTDKNSSLLDEPNDGEANHYETQMNIMRALNNSFGFDVAVGSPAGYTKWYIDTDSSISANASGLEGTEIISPPMKLEEALSTLEKVFEWMQRFGLMTNSTTGFHINVSLPDIEKLDKLKAVLFFGETNALKLFDREASTYAKKHLSQPLTTDGVDIGGDFDILVAELNKRIDESKYRTLNFGKLKDGYLEVRVAGGRDYEKDFDKIKSFILRIVSVLDVACNPAAERQEYMKKLFKTFDISAKLDTEMQVAADQDFGMMIGNFVPSTAGASSYKLIMKHASSYADEPLDEKVLWASRAMFRPLHTFLEANGKHGLSMLSPKHIAQIKNVLKVMKLTDIRAAVKELDPSNRSDSSLKHEILDRITYVLDKLNIK